MPYTMNGIGTSYWGKSHLEYHRGACEHCGAVGDLASYDTGKYFVLFFLPMIPLGKLRIVNECPRCSRHGAIQLKEWQRLSREEVAAAVSAWKANPGDRERAMAAIHACAAYHDRKTFLPLAGKVVGHLGADAEVVAEVAGVLGYFGHLPEAEAAFKKSLSLRDDEGVRQRLAMTLLRQGRPQEARPLLDHLLRGHDPAAPGSLLLLVEGYQAQGLHREALALLDTVAQVYPQTAADQGVEKLRKLSSKHQRSGKPIASAALAPPKPAAGGASLTSRLAPLIWPALLLLIIVPTVGWAVAAARSHQVFLVNGLDRRYAVELAEDGGPGETHHLPPGVAVAVDVPRGVDLVAAIAAGGPAVEPVAFRVEPSLWQALGGDMTYAVNPDRVAVLYWEQVEYAVNPEPKELPYEVKVGEGFYAWEGVDYEFRESPDEISLSSSSSRALRESLTVLSQTPQELFFTVAGEIDDATALTWLRRVVELQPQDPGAMSMLAAMATAEDFATVAAPHLEARPIAIEWHRAYQSAMDRTGDVEPLRERYRAMLDAEPESSELLYLTARLETDAAAVDRLLDQAIAADRSNGYAYNSLAYHRLARGEFAAALAMNAKALAAMPDNPSFRFNEENALLATGRYDELLRRNLEAQTAAPEDGELVAEEIRLRSALGQGEEAAARVEAWVERLRSEQGAESAVGWNEYLGAIAAHAGGDLAAFGEQIGELEGPLYDYQAALARGAMSDAEAALELAEGSDATSYLLAYLGAVRSGERQLAERLLARGIEGLRQEGQAERLLADGLAGSAPAGTDFLGLGLDPHTKAIALAALALRDPGRAATYRRLARRLNFRLAFPRLYLERMLSG